MKKIFTFSSILILSVVILAGCTKRSYYDDGNDYWLSKEYGVVVYSDSYCPYFVVETYNGYTIIRSGGYRPYEGDEIYGDLSRTGYRDLYSYTDNVVFRGEVTDYWLTYGEAQYMIDNLCYGYNKSATKKTIQQGLLKPKSN
ncbi:MAG TPA: hypothetical protein VHN59_09575 [Chitinophagaceae bacterium]|nr:hypothetical protein [Chitinophagaceae bacterium]